VFGRHAIELARRRSGFHAFTDELQALRDHPACFANERDLPL